MNFMFVVNEILYVTAFDTGWFRKCAPVSKVPDDIMEKLKDDLAKKLVLNVTDIKFGKFSTVDVKGYSIVDGIKYNVDTEKEIPVFKDEPELNIVNNKTEKDVTEPIIENTVTDNKYILLCEIEDTGIKTIDVTRLKEDGDVYCIESNWRYIDSYYVADIIYEKKRYIHSDKLGIELEVVDYD